MSLRELDGNIRTYIRTYVCTLYGNSMNIRTFYMRETIRLAIHSYSIGVHLKQALIYPHLAFCAINHHWEDFDLNPVTLMTFKCRNS